MNLIDWVNIVFAYACDMATLSTTGGEKKEVNKHIGHFSTFMRLLTEKNQHLQSQFDKVNEIQNGTKSSSLNQILFDNHEQVADRGKIKGQLALENLFGFCKTIKKITKN